MPPVYPTPLPGPTCRRGLARWQDDRPVDRDSPPRPRPRAVVDRARRPPAPRAPARLRGRRARSLRAGAVPARCLRGRRRPRSARPRRGPPRATPGTRSRGSRAATRRRTTDAASRLLHWLDAVAPAPAVGRSARVLAGRSRRAPGHAPRPAALRLRREPLGLRDAGRTAARCRARRAPPARLLGPRHQRRRHPRAPRGAHGRVAARATSN